MGLFDNEGEENDTYKVDYNQDWLKFITFVYFDQGFNGGFDLPTEELDLVPFYPFCPLIPKDKTLLLLWKDIYGMRVLGTMVDIYKKDGSSLAIDYLLGEDIDDTIFAKTKFPLSAAVLMQMREELQNHYFGSSIQDNDIGEIKYLMHSIFEVYYKMYGMTFDLNIHKIDRLFKNQDLLKTLARLYLSGFIHFEGYGFEVIRKGYVSLELGITIDSSLKEIFDASIANKDMLIETAFSSMYTKFSAIKKNGEIKTLERDVEFSGDEVKFVELQKQYPHSEIKAKNYKGKVTKYEVKEKIKFSSDKI